MAKFKSGEKVTWAWGAHRAEGEVAEVFTRRVSRTIKGRKVTRNGTRQRPAYLVRQENGDRVLKLESELS